MLSPKKTLDTYYLEARRDLVEVAAMLDRYDQSVKRDGEKAQDESKRFSLLKAMEILSNPDHPSANRAEQLLNHFSEIS